MAMLLARETDLEGVVAAGGRVVGEGGSWVPGYPARPFAQHLADSLARHAAEQAAGVSV